MHITNETSYISKNQVINESVMMKDERITIEGTVNGDVYATGDAVTITGTINGNVYIIAKDISLSGKVRESVYVSGKKISIHDIEVGNDVKALGDMICITNSTDVKGGLFYWSGKKRDSCKQEE